MCVGTLPGVYTAGTAGICIQVCAGTGTGAGTDFRTGTRRLGKFGTTSIPVPKTSVISVRHQYRHRKFRCVRYDINTGTENFGKFGTSIPVPETSVGSVHLQCTGQFGKFGTTSIPVPDTSISSVRHPTDTENAGTVPNTPLEIIEGELCVSLEILTGVAFTAFFCREKFKSDSNAEYIQGVRIDLNN